MEKNTKVVCKLYLKNQEEFELYLRELCKEKDNPTLEDVEFKFDWGFEIVSEESP